MANKQLTDVKKIVFPEHVLLLIVTKRFMDAAVPADNKNKKWKESEKPQGQYVDPEKKNKIETLKKPVVLISIGALLPIAKILSKELENIKRN